MENITRYFKDIAKSNPLTLQEEYELATRIQKGDQVALNSLVEANLKFVVTKAREFQGRGMSLEDLICEGNVGLIEAAKRFDPSSGFRFISYAVFWIEQAIIYAISNNRNVRLPMNRIGDLNSIRKLRDSKNSLGERISDKEISKTLGISVRDIQALDRINVPTVSLDFKIGEEEDDTLESIIRNRDADPDEDLAEEGLVHSLKLIIDSLLSKREARIVCLSYGIGCSELSDEDIGKEMGVSGERIRQLKIQAISKIRKNSRARNYLREYLG